MLRPVSLFCFLHYSICKLNKLLNKVHDNMSQGIKSKRILLLLVLYHNKANIFGFCFEKISYDITLDFKIPLLTYFVLFLDIL